MSRKNQYMPDGNDMLPLDEEDRRMLSRMEQDRFYSGGYRQQGGRKKKKRRSRAGKVIWNIVRIILIILLTVLIAGGIVAFVEVRGIIAKAPQISPSQFIPSEAATYIYDQDGNRQQKLTLPEANRDLVSIKDIPKDLQHAVVAIEDERFYQHHGIDPRGIARALIKGLSSGHFSEGASTITQQLVKNMFLSQEQSFGRKAEELLLAIDMELHYSKAEILEMYLNSIYFGSGYYGIQEASEGY